MRKVPRQDLLRKRTHAGNSQVDRPSQGAPSSPDRRRRVKHRKSSKLTDEGREIRAGNDQSTMHRCLVQARMCGVRSKGRSMCSRATIHRCEAVLRCIRQLQGRVLCGGNLGIPCALWFETYGLFQTGGMVCRWSRAVQGSRIRACASLQRVLLRRCNLPGSPHNAKKCSETTANVSSGRSGQSIPVLGGSGSAVEHCLLHQLVKRVQFSSKRAWNPIQKRPRSQAGKEVTSSYRVGFVQMEHSGAWQRYSVRHPISLSRFCQHHRSASKQGRLSIGSHSVLACFLHL